jgi:ATP-dependent Clp protease ATP-binding subunit ClpC
MQIYSIFIPELGTNVKFKVLLPSDVEEFMDKNKRLKKDNLKKKILQNYVFNLNTDVAQSLSLMSRTSAEKAIEAIYSGCVMLNPSLDIEYWIDRAYSGAPEILDIIDDHHNHGDIDQVREFIERSNSTVRKQLKPLKDNKKITKQKFLGLENYLKNNVIGQDHAIETIVSTLCRSQADLHDENSPLGVFLFAGSSGVGKTHLAQTLHTYLYGASSRMVRIDCGEFQHKHENQKLLGSPPGYVGHDEGGQLTNQIKKNPYTVLLLDEVEKAHEDMWNTFLRIFDEGIVTDNKGDEVDFTKSIIVMTTNLGNDKVVKDATSIGVGFNAKIDFSRRTTHMPSRSIVEKRTHEAIEKYFKPEFINRIDKIVVFNHLSKDDCIKIAELEMSVIAKKLTKKGLGLEYTDNVIDGLIELGIDSIKGARGISQIRRESIESKLAQSIVANPIPKGTIFYVDYKNSEFLFDIKKPIKKSNQNTKNSTEDGE